MSPELRFLQEWTPQDSEYLRQISLACEPVDPRTKQLLFDPLVERLEALDAECQRAHEAERARRAERDAARRWASAMAWIAALELGAVLGLLAMVLLGRSC